MKDNSTNHTRRTYIKHVAGVGLAGGVAGVAGCIGDDVEEDDDGLLPVRMASSSGASLAQLLTDVIIGEGFDERNGISLEITEAGPAEVPQLVINGSVDTGFGNPIGMANARTQGHNVSLFGPWIRNHSSLLVGPDSDVQEWEDLVGDSIGMLSPPSGIWFHTAMVLNGLGLDIEEDFETHTGAPPAILSWITGGDVDAGVLFYPLITSPLVEGDLLEVAFMPEVFEDVYGRVFDFVNLIALDEWLDEDHDRALQFQRTTVETHEWVMNNPVETLERYGPNSGVETDEEIELTAEKLPDIVSTWDTDQAKENIQEELELAQELGMLDSDAPTDIVADI